MTTRRMFLLSTLLAPALLLGAVSGADAARPFPIKRVPGAEVPNSGVRDVDLLGTRLLLGDNGGQGTVYVRSTRKKISLKMRDARWLSGNGLLAFGVSEAKGVLREKVGSNKVVGLKKAVPNAGWIPSAVDSDATGRYLAVSAGNGNFGRSSVFLADTKSGTTIDVGAAVPSGAGQQSFSGTISSDGRYVAFTAYGAVGGPSQVYVYDRSTKATTLVTRTRTGTPSTGAVFAPTISANGRVVVFASTATDLVSTGTTGTTAVFRRDLSAGTTTLVSPTVMFFSDVPRPLSVSADGKRVAFTDNADISVPGGGTAQDSNVFIWTNGTRQRVSLDVAGGRPNGPSFGAVMSADGRLVAFTSTATDLTNAKRSGAFTSRLTGF